MLFVHGPGRKILFSTPFRNNGEYILFKNKDENVHRYAERGEKRKRYSDIVIKGFYEKLTNLASHINRTHLT